MSHQLIRIRSILEGNEAESLGTTRFSIYHWSGIDNFAISGEELSHRFSGRVRCQPADKITRVTEMFFPRNRTFGINLCRDT